MLCFVFAVRKVLQILWKIVLILSLYIFKKYSVFDKYKKQYVINLSFLTLWKMAKFFLQMFVVFNMITDSFLVEKRRTLERARRYVCKNLLYFDISIFVWAFIKLLRNKESFGKSFSFSFPAKYSDRNLKCLFEKLSNFFILYFAIS